MSSTGECIHPAARLQQEVELSHPAQCITQSGYAVNTIVVTPNKFTRQSFAWPSQCKVRISWLRKRLHIKSVDACTFVHLLKV